MYDSHAHGHATEAHRQPASPAPRYTLVPGSPLRTPATNKSRLKSGRGTDTQRAAGCLRGQGGGPGRAPRPCGGARRSCACRDPTERGGTRRWPGQAPARPARRGAVLTLTPQWGGRVLTLTRHRPPRRHPAARCVSVPRQPAAHPQPRARSAQRCVGIHAGCN